MSSGFISESEILEARRRRQEEWEKVRTADQPEGKIPEFVLIALGSFIIVTFGIDKKNERFKTLQRYLWTAFSIFFKLSRF